MNMAPWLRGVGKLIASSIVLIVLALVYFVVTAWIVAFGVDLVVGTEPSADFVALAASLLSIGSLAGSTLTMSGTSDAGRADEDYTDQEVV